MEDFLDLPETSWTPEEAKCGQHGAISRLRDLLDRFESSDFWGNCLEQLQEAADRLKVKTVALEMAYEREEEGEE